MSERLSERESRQSRPRTLDREPGGNRRGGYLDLSVITPRVRGERGADRGFIAGRSGSGKSFLAREILNVYDIPERGTPKGEFGCFLVVIDPNHTFEFRARRTTEDPDQAIPHTGAPSILYRPSQAAAEEPAVWSGLFHRLFHVREPVMVYLDETFALEPLFGVRRLPGGNGLTQYLTRGRAKLKGALLAAQRPVQIPRNVIAQAEWFYQFDLPSEEDRLTMAGVIGRTSADGEDLRDRRSLGRYEFWFQGPDQPDPVRMRVVP